jgi:hypothetical protein
MSLNEHAQSTALPVNKRRDRALKMQLKAQPSGSSLRWTSGKTLIQLLVSSVLLAFFVAVAIPVSYLITSGKTRWKDLGDLQIVSEPTPTPRLATRSGSMPAAPNAVYAGTVGTVVAENSTQSVHLAPVPSPTPVPQPTVIVNDTGSHSARMSAADRKAAERERQKAERKRARLEAMYQSHLISSAAYKKGQDEYQSEITKYHSAFNSTALTDEIRGAIRIAHFNLKRQQKIKILTSTSEICFPCAPLH